MPRDPYEALPDEEEETVKPQYASVASSTFNLTKNVLAASVVSLPWTLQEASVIPGLFLLILSCYACAYSFILLAKCTLLTSTETYVGIAEKLYSKGVGTLVQVVMMLYTFGSCISFLVLLGDFCPAIADALKWNFMTDKASAIWITCVFCTALCFIDKLDNLRFSSIVGLVCALYLCFMVVGSAIGEGTIDPSVRQFEWSIDIFNAVPIYSIAYAAHYNTPDFFVGLGRDMNKFRVVVTLESAAILVLYVAVALAGYYQFGNAVMSDVLLSFSVSDGWALAARLCLAFSVIFTYPFPFYCLRKNFVLILSMTCVGSSPACQGKKTPSLNFHSNVESVSTTQAQSQLQIEAHNPLSGVKMAAVIILLNALSALMALVVPDMATILDFKGALLGTPIIYVFPGAFYLSAMAKQHSIHWTKLPLSEKYGPLLLISFGMVTGTLALYAKITYYLH